MEIKINKKVKDFTPEEKRKYHRDYMRKKRAKQNYEEIVVEYFYSISRGGIEFRKYFYLFKIFVQKHYCIPTTRELILLSGVSNSRYVGNFFKELTKRGIVEKLNNRYTFTKYGFNMFF